MERIRLSALVKDVEMGGDIDVVIAADAQRALDAEREKVKALEEQLRLANCDQANTEADLNDVTAQLATLQAQLRQVEGERDGLEQNCLNNHVTTEQADEKVKTLRQLVGALPKIKGTIFETVASCRGEGGPESWVRFEVALAALLTHRQSMDTPIDLSPKIKDDGGYGEHF